MNFKMESVTHQSWNQNFISQKATSTSVKYIKKIGLFVELIIEDGEKLKDNDLQRKKKGRIIN